MVQMYVLLCVLYFSCIHCEPKKHTKLFLDIT